MKRRTARSVAEERMLRRRLMLERSSLHDVIRETYVAIPEQMLEAAVGRAFALALYDGRTTPKRPKYAGAPEEQLRRERAVRRDAMLDLRVRFPDAAERADAYGALDAIAPLVEKYQAEPRRMTIEALTARILDGKPQWDKRLPRLGAAIIEGARSFREQGTNAAFSEYNCLVKSLDALLAAYEGPDR